MAWPEFLKFFTEECESWRRYLVLNTDCQLSVILTTMSSSAVQCGRPLIMIIVMVMVIVLLSMIILPITDHHAIHPCI